MTDDNDSWEDLNIYSKYICILFFLRWNNKIWCNFKIIKRSNNIRNKLFLINYFEITSNCLYILKLISFRSISLDNSNSVYPNVNSLINISIWKKTLSFLFNLKNKEKNAFINGLPSIIINRLSQSLIVCSK